MAVTRRVSVPGSERQPVPGAKVLGPADPSQRISVTLVLHPRQEIGSERRPCPLSRLELAAARGADLADIALIQEFAHLHGLDIAEISLPRRSVVLAGSVDAMSRAFTTQLSRVQLEGRVVRQRTGALTVPQHLGGRIAAVLGLDDRPQARPHFRIGGAAAGAGQARALAAAVTPTFTPPQLAAIYQFPPGDGTGECIAIVELGGGYTAADINAYFAGLGLTPPAVTAIAVDNGANSPSGDPSSADGEVLLDIEVAGAVAPGAKIAVYFAPNTSQGFVDAVTSAIHDSVNNPSVVSISWGQAEEGWTAQAIQAMDQAFQDAAALGVTILVASGDDGSEDSVADGQLHTDFPASSPNVTACGGTTLTAGAGSAIGDEVVWNAGAGNGAGGGGISRSFAVPAYQAGAQVPAAADDGHTGRGVPDVAADADPATGYQVLVNGQNLVFGGTSAVAPLYAGLVARINQQLAAAGVRAGFLNPLLYGAAMVPAGFSDVVDGNNNVNGVGGSAYDAAPGWDPATGWGSIIGTVLQRAMTIPPGAAATAGPTPGPDASGTPASSL
ncbi:MAG TPA: S53 family peptidase [Thermoanaerobaculia bacterium]